MKIVFYIRAIFGQSDIITGSVNKKNLVKASAKFTELSNISLKEYRDKIHDLQKEVLNNISSNFIINNKTSNKISFGFCQPESYEKFLQLDDDDIIIPLDDDDWLLPNIKNINFEKNGLTCWSSFVLREEAIKLSQHNKHLPKILNEEELKESKRCLSNCYSISANVVKQIIKQADQYKIKILNILLQRHSRAREIIRELNFEETVIDDYLSVYVKHAGNMTTIQSLDSSDENAKFIFEEFILPYKDYPIIPFDKIPQQMQCYYKYIQKLKKINMLL